MGPAEPIVFEGHHRIIFELLTARGLIPAESLLRVWAEHEAGGTAFAQLLLERQVFDRPGLLRALAEQLGCDYAEKLPEHLPPEILRLVEPGLARTFGVVPLWADEMALTVLVSDPFDPQLQNELSFALGRRVNLAMADPERVQALVLRYYGQEETAEFHGKDEAQETQESTTEAEDLSEADIEKMAGQTPIIRLVNLVLAQAIRDGASDLHFEPFAREFKIRYRIDGTLCDLTPPARSLALPIISRLKVLANLNIAERRLPQDGRISLRVGGRSVDLRVSTLPTQFGESVVLRVLDQSTGHLDLDQIGLPPAIRPAIDEIIRRPNGMFVVTGPTGSGKTTTLYSCLKQLNTVDAKLLSVEDPVEYEIDGVMQVPVNPFAGLTFARALRAFLRQDPDVVMVGEIRDLETAQVAIQASLTGHLVLSTLHTNDAPGAVTRLVDMGVEPFLLASTLEGVLAQRLVRRVCPSCKMAVAPGETELRLLGLDRAAIQARPFYSGKGCAECHGTGYKGRKGIFEFLRLTETVRALVLQGATLVDLRRKAVDEGMTTLRDAGIEAILAGETTLEEVIRYT